WIAAAEEKGGSGRLNPRLLQPIRGRRAGQGLSAAPGNPTGPIMRTVPCWTHDFSEAAVMEGDNARQPGAGFCSIDEALDELRGGRMVVLVDDEFRENEGDLVIAAEKATPEAINFMMRNGCGLVCLAMSPAICDRLGLELLPGKNVDPQATPFTTPI